MEEIILNKKEWLEILEQNKQYAKNYFVNFLIASNAIKILEEKIKLIEINNPLVIQKEKSGEDEVL